jgi:hypothetical protein
LPRSKEIIWLFLESILRIPFRAAVPYLKLFVCSDCDFEIARVEKWKMSSICFAWVEDEVRKERKTTIFSEVSVFLMFFGFELGLTTSWRMMSLMVSEKRRDSRIHMPTRPKLGAENPTSASRGEELF